MIFFIAMISYLYHRQDEKYLYWLAAGLALMLSTKEVAYIYIAIFGSFLLLHLGVNVLQAPWLRSGLQRVRTPLIVALVGLVLLGSGLLLSRAASRAAEEASADGTTAAQSEGFAVDPNADTTVVAGTEPADIGGWIAILGIVTVGAGLFFVAANLRDELSTIPSFDLVVVLTALVIPTLAAFPAVISGWTPRDYSVGTCSAGADQAGSLTDFLLRFVNPDCLQAYVTSGNFHVGAFLVLLLATGLGLGFWWQRRKFLVIAIIFNVIFVVLYTSVFTNGGGWFSGMVDSLAYWMEQHDVQRGSQPWFYYLFVVPFYEFLPLLFSLLAIRRWMNKERLGGIVNYWVSVVLLALLSYSLGNWAFNLSIRQANGEESSVFGLLLGAVVIAAGLLFFFLRQTGRIRQAPDFTGWGDLFDSRKLLSFVPLVTYWLLATWLIYSIAGEKMPWLSTHFVIPMAILAGWYFNDLLANGYGTALLNGRALLRIGGLMLFMVLAIMALGPWLLGEISFGDQTATNLSGIGHFLGLMVLLAGLGYGLSLLFRGVSGPLRGRSVILALFALLSLLTIRFTYMANFPNADYTTEYMVYAHGAPVTKSQVLAKVEDLSMRLYGDKSIAVAFDNDSSWPMTWYLREYPKRVYFGANPGRNILESPVIIVGSNNWGTVEPLLRDEYVEETYTFLWWPMEEYRKFSWDALFGVEILPAPEGTPRELQRTGRGLGSAGVRQALWDIFFQRDYEQFGTVFGGTYTTGEWPVRHALKLYVRKDVIAHLWDYGVGAVAFEPTVDPYADGEIPLAPVAVIGSPGAGLGQLQAPRNIAVGPDGRLYVADTGNHRIQIFSADGQALTTFGEFGTGAGQFNEPWGIAVDETFIYVTDTWNHRIQKFTLDGTFVASFGSSGSAADGNSGLGLFFGPRDIELLGDALLLVTDTGNHRIQVLDRDGNFQQQIGTYGFSVGQFYEPVGLATGVDGTVYVADTWNSRIQLLSNGLFPSGEWALEDVWLGESINNKPYLATDANGYVYVTDPEGFRVLIFDSQGNYTGRFGQFSTGPDGFNQINGIAVDAQGFVYVVDAGNSQILKLPPFAPGSGAPGGAAQDGSGFLVPEIGAPVDEGLVPAEDQEGAPGEVEPAAP